MPQAQVDTKLNPGLGRPHFDLTSHFHSSIGRGLLARYLALPDHAVIAANRDPDGASSRALSSLPRGEGTRPLLEKSKWEPILMTNMGGTTGSSSAPLPFSNAAYGPSKLASAWYTLKIHLEDDWLHSFSLCLGWVHTNLGDAAKAFGVDEVLSATTKAEHGGKLILYNGETVAW
ncbi:hypothetical protein B0T26DRAFT_747165 [Lasiosphaeria miniovina]|uniref:Uncharacterized protein n=1 Tax=Lasiosphaeria miniovina TaxID=1954250 RepID=A0AA40B3B4_9PEZI|nr:uncharacterized protein B0T26DRAFT_747165 [Lasiosphaeria miniovina]KAK0726758.1 hypothetical protein B0T26DRAFT_747165 [Lasiosphaeria miniovina]